MSMQINQIIQRGEVNNAKLVEAIQIVFVIARLFYEQKGNSVDLRLSRFDFISSVFFRIPIPALRFEGNCVFVKNLYVAGLKSRLSSFVFLVSPSFFPTKRYSHALSLFSMMPHKVCCAIILSALCLSTIAAGQDVRNRMNEFVDSVKDAVKEAESANNKREVVDLGQSLHLLEGKFAGLRAALSQELGAKASKVVSHSDASKELMDKSTDLVRGVVGQREELRRLSSDVKEVDSAVRALRAGLDNFEKDVATLGKIMSDLHVSHNELSATHDEAREKMREVIADRNDKHMRGGGHGFLVFALLVEIVIFVAYLYFKRPGGALAHKAYGKFG